MEIIFQVFIIFFIFTSGVHLSFENTDDWSYYGKNGPDHWPGMCLTGKKQSPISIMRNNTVETNVEALKFVRYDYAYTGTLTNTGHTVQVGLTGVPMFLKGGGLFSTYVFEQMHLHWSAEHTIDGNRPALELHMVHYAKQYENFTFASQHDYGLCVVAVLFKIGAKDNQDLSPIVEASKVVSPLVGDTIQIEGKIVPTNLLPQDYTSFYRYEGSLTTPNCLETVTWFILNEKLTISESQLKVFQNVMTSNGSLTFNYRPLQKLGLRNVYRRLSDYSGASTMSQKSSVYLSTLVAIISMLLFVP